MGFKLLWANNCSDYQKAEEYYQQSALLCPDRASTYTALGFVVHMLGETDRAIEYYHKALALDASDPVAEVRVKKLSPN